MNRRELRARALAAVQVPLAVQVQCEACGTQWLERSKRAPLFFKCPECGKRRGVRVQIHDIEDSDDA